VLCIVVWQHSVAGACVQYLSLLFMSHAPHPCTAVIGGCKGGHWLLVPKKYLIPLFWRICSQVSSDATRLNLHLDGPLDRSRPGCRIEHSCSVLQSFRHLHLYTSFHTFIDLNTIFITFWSSKWTTSNTL